MTTLLSGLVSELKRMLEPTGWKLMSADEFFNCMPEDWDEDEDDEGDEEE